MIARVRPYILLFIGLSGIYHANFRPIDSSDTLPASLVPFALVLDHTITLDRFGPWLSAHVWYTPSVIRYKNGHYFSAYPIGAPLLVSPLYTPAIFFARHWDPATLVALARIAEKFAATALTAGSAVWLLLLLQRITTEGWAWTLTLVYALATETWSISSQALWQHGAGELVIIGSYYYLERWLEDSATNRWLWLCGIFTAAAVVVRPTSLVLAPAMIAALFIAKATFRQYVRLLAPTILIVVLVASYNWYVFHRLSGGYGVRLFRGSVAGGLAGLYFSPGRGLLLYTPVLLFALAAFTRRAAASRNSRKALVASAVTFVVLTSISVAPSVFWWGGYAWGPRLLTEIVPALIVLMALGVPAIEQPWARRAFAVLAAYSLFIQFAGAFFYPNGQWDSSPQPVNRAPGRLWDWRDNPIARTVSGGIYWQPYAIVGAAITGGVPAAARRMQELNVSAVEGTEFEKGPELPCRACRR